MREVSGVKTISLTSLPMPCWLRKVFTCCCTSEAWLVNLDQRWNREGLVTTEEGCFFTLFVTSKMIWSGDGQSRKDWWRIFTAPCNDEATSSTVILLRITSWTRRCKLRDFVLFLWKSENLVKISAMWFFIRGRYEFLRDWSSTESSGGTISSSGISVGSKNAAMCMKRDAIGPWGDLLTYSKFISHVVCTASRLLDS